MYNSKQRRIGDIVDFNYWTRNGTTLVDEEGYYEIPAFILNTPESFDAPLTVLMELNNLTINKTSKVLFSFLVERYNKKNVLQNVRTPHTTQNKLLIPLNKNLYFQKELPIEYQFFQLLRDHFKFVYKDVVRFVKELKKCKAFVVHKGSYFRHKCTEVSFRGFKFVDFKGWTDREKLGIVLQLSCYQESLLRYVHNYIKHFNYEVKCKYASEKTNLELYNSNVEFLKMNKNLRKAEKKSGCVGLQYSRIFRNNCKEGGRMYNLLTSIPSYLRKIILDECGLKELDGTSMQLRQINQYMNNDKEIDYYMQLISKCNSVNKNKHNYLLRQFAKRAASIYLNAKQRRYVQFMIQREFEDLGLIYTDNQVFTRRNKATELYNKGYDNPYKTTEYLSHLKSMKDVRMSLFNENYSEELSEIAKHFSQKNLKAFTFEILTALEELYNYDIILKIQGKLELPESNALIEMMNSEDVVIGLHDCIIVRKDKPNSLKDKFMNLIKNEMFRLKKQIITFSYKKVLKVKNWKFNLIPQGYFHSVICNTIMNDKIQLIC